MAYARTGERPSEKSVPGAQDKSPFFQNPMTPTDNPTTAPGYHIPVLLQESVDALQVRPEGCYVDCTFGGGGHSREILRRLGPKGRLLGFDQDVDAVQNAPADDSRFTFVRSNFRWLSRWLDYYGEDYADGILADLGVSSHHFDVAERGFSFRFDAPLDMRMNQAGSFTAADLLNTYEEGELQRVFRLYGEFPNALQLARAVVKARTVQPLLRTGDLIRAVEPCLHPARRKKDLAPLFQALRIEVNHEMEALEQLLETSAKVLRPGGRLVVLTYHSLEDRMVKNFMRSGRLDGKIETDFYGNRLSPLRPLSKLCVAPSAEEQARNPRSRSARLRVCERIEPLGAT